MKVKIMKLRNVKFKIELKNEKMEEHDLWDRDREGGGGEGDKGQEEKNFSFHFLGTGGDTVSFW